MNILIIDDNIALCRALSKILKHNGYGVETANDGQTGLRFALENNFDIILLDIMMPQMNGYKVLEHLRKEKRTTPVIMITAKDTVSDNIDALDLGADDYIQKPFNTDILLAKMRALARRSSIPDYESDILEYGDISLTVSTNEVSSSDLKITLSEPETNLLRFMIKNSSAVISYEKLAQIGNLSYNGENRVFSYLESISKILKLIKSKIKIINIKGVGYKLC